MTTSIAESLSQAVEIITAELDREGEEYSVTETPYGDFLLRVEDMKIYVAWSNTSPANEAIYVNIYDQDGQWVAGNLTPSEALAFIP